MLVVGSYYEHFQLDYRNYLAENVYFVQNFLCVVVAGIVDYFADHLIVFDDADWLHVVAHLQ